MSGRLVLYGSACSGACPLAMRDEPVVGGASKLALAADDGAAAPYEQFFESDLQPLGPFEATDPPAEASAAPLSLVSPPSTALLNKGRQPHPESVQAAAQAVQAAVPMRMLAAAELQKRKEEGAERAHSEAAMGAAPPPPAAAAAGSRKKKAAGTSSGASSGARRPSAAGGEWRCVEFGGRRRRRRRRRLEPRADGGVDGGRAGRVRRGGRRGL